MGANKLFLCNLVTHVSIRVLPSVRLSATSEARFYSEDREGVVPGPEILLHTGVCLGVEGCEDQANPETWFPSCWKDQGDLGKSVFGVSI